MRGDSWFLSAVAFALVLASALSVLLALRGADKWSRLLGYNLAAGKVNMLIVVIALATGKRFYLDIAIVYLLIGYIGQVVLADYMVEQQ